MTDNLLTPIDPKCKMPYPSITVTILLILVSDSNFGHNYVNRSNIWIEDSGKHHRLGQSNKSVLDPTGHLLTTNGGKRYIVINVVAQQTLHTQIYTKNSYIHQPLSNPECKSERELK